MKKKKKETTVRGKESNTNIQLYIKKKENIVRYKTKTLSDKEKQN